MKKKLLTLAFTLVLLIGLVAAMGMNASAATTYTARNRLSYVNTADNLWNYVAQSYTGDVIALSGNITYDDKNDADPYTLPFGAQGDMVLDLNGYTLDITTRADALVELDYGTTRLHIVNSRPDVPAKIIMRTKVGNSSMIDISKKECGVYVYEGVELVMGKEGDTAEAYKQTSVISATEFSDIAVYGGNLTNNIANGAGIVLDSDNSVQFDNSTVTLHGGAEVTAKTSSIFLNDAYDYPTFNIGSAYLECDGEYYAAISNYIPASSASSQVKALTFANIVANGYSAYQTEGSGRLEGRIIASSTKLLDYNTKGGLTFKLTGVTAECNHNASTTLLNSFFGHYDVCTKCYKLRDASGEAKIVTHTYKEATSATCTADGYSAGYDCGCGYKTITKTGDSLGHSYRLFEKRDATCTATGYYTNVYLCENCSAKFDSNKVELTPVQFSKLVIPKKGHDMVKVAAKKATTTADGNIEYYDCSRCDHISSDAEGKIAIETAKVTKIGSVTLSKENYVYDGKNKTPTVTVKDANGKKLTKNTDYKLSVASSRKGIGRYTVKVTFIGNYEGTKNLYFYIKPGKPASVKSASQTTSSVKLSWSKVAGAAGYTVYRYSPSKKAYVKAGTTEGTSLTVKSLYAGTKYTFKVVAYGKTSGGKVYDSDSYALLKTATKTKTPTLSKVTTTKGKATLTHTDVSGETGYTVYYSTKKDSGFKKYDNFKANTKTATVSGLTSGKTYYFKVRTYIKTDSGYVYSAWSTVKSVKIK